MSSKVQRLYLNSYYGIDTNNETPSAFDISLGSIVSVQNVGAVELNAASLVFTPTSPNLGDEYMLYLELNGVANTFTIDPLKVYDNPNDLVNEINNTIQNVGTFSFDTDYMRIVYNPPNANDTWVMSASTNNILRRIGAHSDNEDATGTGNYTFPNPPIIIRTTCLFLSSSLDSSGFSTLDGAPPILAQITLNSGEYGSIINFNLQNVYLKSDLVSENISTVSFQVLDDRYRPLLLTRNAMLNIELSIQYSDPNINNRPAPLFIPTFANF